MGCVQNDVRGYGTFEANRAPILRQDYPYLQTDQNELSLEPRHLGVPSCAYKTISEPMICSAQTIHLSCVKISTIFEKVQNEIPHEPHHLVVLSSASKMISEPILHLAQTMHLSCTDTNTVSKWKQARFHMTHVN
jgi:hypothetical protein